MFSYEFKEQLLAGIPEETRQFYAVSTVKRMTEQASRLIDLIGARGFIGGSFAAWATSYNPSIEPNDIDIFAVSPEDARVIAGEISSFPNGYLPYIGNDVAYSISHSSAFPENRSVQVIIPRPEWTVFPRDFLLSFDLDICSAVILSHTHTLAHMNAALDEAKILRMNNPLRTLRRVLKYSDRGVMFSDHELLKIFRFWSELPEARQKELIDNARPTAAPWVDEGSEILGRRRLLRRGIRQS